MGTGEALTITEAVKTERSVEILMVVEVEGDEVSEDLLAAAGKSTVLKTGTDADLRGKTCRKNVAMGRMIALVKLAAFQLWAVIGCEFSVRDYLRI